MIQIIPVFFGLLMVAVTTFTAPIKDQMGNVQIVYHVGDIAEHAYNTEAWNTNINPPNLLPHIPKLPPHSTTGILQRNNSIQHNNRKNNENRPTTETAMMAKSTSTRSSIASTSTTSTLTKTQHLSSMSTTITPPLNLDSTEKSLEAFLAMLDETRTIDAPPEAALLTDQKQSANNPVTTTTTTDGAPPRNPPTPHDWAVYDDLDTQESNQTAVIASNQKFGYIVHGNNYKRFRVEEKNANGLITGLFGVHHNNGGFRGVQYAADPASINPKVLYDTLVKFLSL